MENYNFYCDESHYLQNDGQDFMVLGTLYCHKSNYKKIKNEIKKIKQKHGYSYDYELKWTKINNQNVECIIDIFRYIYSNTDILIRILVAKGKSALKLDWFNLDYNEWYHRMYYYLLKHPFTYRLRGNIEASLYLDHKDSYSQVKFDELANVMNLNFQDKNVYFTSKSCDSKDFVLIQIIDLIIGAVAYNLKNNFKNDNKIRVLSALKEIFKIDFPSEGSSTNSRVNYFVWKPKLRK